MDATTLFSKTLEQATAVINHVDEKHFDVPTPCDDWNMKALCNHLLYELAWVSDLVEGKTIAEVGDKYDGDLIKNDLKSNWDLAAERARQAIKNIKPGSQAHLSYGDVPIEEYLVEVSNDLAIHAWDIAQGLYCTMHIDDDIVRHLYERAELNKDSIEGSGIFGKSVNDVDEIELQQKLLALMGRPSEKWNARTSN